MQKKMFQGKAKVIAKQKYGSDYFRLTLDFKDIARIARPGQFVQVKVNNLDIPLLRRPLGIHQVKGGTFSVLCEIVGPATEILAQKNPGECLDIIGPLGNSFSLKNPAVIVAGGMGVAPLMFLAEKLAEVKNQKPKIKNLVLIGAQTKKHILCANEFQKLGCGVKIATDDGSSGYKGKVTDLLKDLLLTVNCKPLTIYACGPKPMLKEISLISKKTGINAEISLEAHLSCGIGACLGCVVKTTGGLKRVCKEGPAFDTKEIIWEEEI